MKITEAQLRQIIKEELSEADPEKRKSVYKAFDWACGNLADVSREIPGIFKNLEIDDDKLRAQVLKVYQKLDIVRKALKIKE